jgi:hypothetical protein
VQIEQVKIRRKIVSDVLSRQVVQISFVKKRPAVKIIADGTGHDEREAKATN